MSVLARVGSRTIQSLIVMFLLLTLLFITARLSGDPVTMMVGGFASAEDIERLRAAWGLNDPLPVQYLRFWANVLRLDFGQSLRTFQPALPLVLDRVGATIQLVIPALAGAVIVGIIVGAFIAVRRGPFGAIAMGLSVLGQSVPSFFLGMMLIFIFGVQLRVLPVFGMGGPENMILPIITLAAYPLARYTRLVRAQVSETMVQDYVRTARAKGLSERTIIIRHVLRNALAPVLTILGVDLGVLIGSAVIVEAIFAWPGFGSLLLEAALARDYPVLQACGFVIGASVVLSSIVVDFAYAIIDPRIRSGS